jgi:hypothetical protein
MPWVMQTLYFGDVFSSAVGFWIVTFLGLVLGAIFYFVCAHPRFRRAPFNRMGPARGWGIFLGTFVAGTLILVAWWLNWAEFYRIDMDARQVRLYYHFPDREKTVSIDAIREITKGVTLDKIDWCRLVLESEDGARYHSANVNPREFDPRFKHIRRFLVEAGCYRK